MVTATAAATIGLAAISAAYYLRFCKSFSRMGGAMQYAQCDNVAFVHGLLHALRD